MYMCVVCSISRPSLVPLTNELIQLLVTLVSPYISMTDFNISYLCLCSGCHIQIQSIHQFQRIALNGLNNLRQSLHSQTVNGGYNHPYMEFVPFVPHGQWNPHPLSYNTIPRQSVPGNAEVPRAESLNVYTHRPMQVSGQGSMRTPPTPVPRERQDLMLESVYLKDEPLIWDPNLDPKSMTDCLATQPDVKSEEKESEFQPQIEGNSDVTCYEVNIEPTIRESERREKTKSVYVKDEPLIWDPNLDPKLITDCHATEPSVKSEEKESEFQPQIEVNRDVACFESNIEPTIRKLDSGVKTKPPKAAQVKKRPINDKPAKLERERLPKERRTENIAKEAVTPTVKDAEEIIAVPSVRKDGTIKRKKKRYKPKPASCPHCNKCLSSKSSLSQHIKDKHTEPVTMECKTCGKQCCGESALRTHMMTHKMDPHLFCQQCAVYFMSPSALKVHLMTLKHTPREKYTYECETCKKKFPTEKRRQDHINVVHLNQKHYKCDACGKSFAKTRQLRTHLAKAHDLLARPKRRAHICHICGKNFTVIKSLREHLLSHEGLRPFQCQLCPATFSYSAALYTHNKLKHLKIKSKRKKTKAGQESADVGKESGGVGKESGEVGKESGGVGKESGEVGKESGEVGKESVEVGKESGEVGKDSLEVGD